MEDNLNFFLLEDNLNVLVKEDNLNFFQMEDKTIKIKTMVVAPLRVT
jgi:hypothetical protein